MSPSEVAVAIAVEALCGVGGALAVRWWWRSARLGKIAVVLAGAIGGVGLTLLAAELPGIGRFVGHVETAADATIGAVGGLTPAILVGVGIAGLLGGIVAATAIGFVGNSMRAGR